MKETYLEQFKDCLKVSYDKTASFIFVLAVHEETKKNNITKISCTKGLPLGGHVYDTSKDCYLVRCVDYLPLGRIKVSFGLEVPGTGGWGMRVPMPPSLVEEFLNGQQKRDFAKFKETFKNNFNFEFLQMVNIF